MITAQQWSALDQLIQMNWTLKDVRYYFLISEAPMQILCFKMLSFVGFVRLMEKISYLGYHSSAKDILKALGFN